MALLSNTIPNLINGVSQQPYALRRPTQAEEQVNAFSSVVDGLTKRPATKHVAKILDNPIGNAFLHTINRDRTERYEVIVTDPEIKKRIADALVDQMSGSGPGI